MATRSEWQTVAAIHLDQELAQMISQGGKRGKLETVRVDSEGAVERWLEADSLHQHPRQLALLGYKSRQQPPTLTHCRFFVALTEPVCRAA